MKSFLLGLFERIMLLEIMAIILLIISILHGCTFPDPGEPVVPVYEASCSSVETHITDLQCYVMLDIPGNDDIVGTEDDPTFEEWCQWVQNSGIDVIDLDCVMDAPTCDAVTVCMGGVVY